MSTVTEDSVLVHVLDEVLQVGEQSAVRQRLQMEGITGIFQLLSLTETDIDGWSEEKKRPGSATNFPALNTQQRVALRSILKWRAYRQSLQNVPVSLEHWTALTREEHQTFIADVLPNLNSRAAGGVGAASLPGAVTARDVEKWNEGHKRDHTKYRRFDGTKELWLRTHRAWLPVAKLDGIGPLMNKKFTPPSNTDLEAYTFFESQNTYLFTVLQYACGNAKGHAKEVIAETSPTQDGFAAYMGLHEHYNSEEVKAELVALFHTKITTWTIPNRVTFCPVDWFTELKTKLLDLDEAQGHATKESYKLAYLKGCVAQNIRLSGVYREVQPPTWKGVVRRLNSEVESMRDERKAARVINATIGDNTGDDERDPHRRYWARDRKPWHRGGRGGGRGRGRDGRGDGPRIRNNRWKKDYTLPVPPENWNKMSRAERAKRLEARKRAKEFAASINASMKRPPHQVQYVPLPPHPSDQASVVSGVTNPAAPTINQIMSTNARPAGNPPAPSNAAPVQGPDGQWYQPARSVNMNRVFRVSSAESDYDSKWVLVDGGSNIHLAGSFFVPMEEPITPELVDISTSQNAVPDAMRNLPVLTHCAKATTKNGHTVLLVAPNMVGYYKGKSILSSHQMRHGGLVVDDVAKKHGGKQKIVTPESYSFGLTYKDALLYLSIAKPTNADIKNLTHVYLGSPGRWDPSSENDEEGTDDAEEDPSDLNDTAFYDSRDGYIREDELEFPVEATVAHMRKLAQGTKQYKFRDEQGALGLQPLIASLRKTRSPFEVDRLYGARKAKDYTAMRRFFCWKPVDVIQKTIEATTQWAQRSLRLPLRRHYKSRYPALRVRRMSETVCTDTFFSDVTALNGYTCAQLFVGRTSMFTAVYPMGSKGQFPESLMDFIRQYGAMNCLFSDNAGEQTSAAVRDILRTYRIADWQSEPLQQNQNYAERQIQNIKAMTNVVMDREAVPVQFWVYAMKYCVHIWNCLANSTLGWRTPTEAAFGVTPDISELLCFHFFEPVLFEASDGSYPDTKERLGRLVGFAPNVGDALTFEVLTDDTKQIICRSVIRPARDLKNPNLRVFTPAGERKTERDPFPKADDTPLLTPSEIVNLTLSGERPNKRPQAEPPPVNGEPVQQTSGILDPDEIVRKSIEPQRCGDQTLIGRTFCLERQADGTVAQATVVREYERVDSETQQYVVKIGDKLDVMTHAAVVDALDKQLQRERDQPEDEKLWFFKEIRHHRFKDGKWEVRVLWEDGSETWEPLSVIFADDPITVSRYAWNEDLLDTPGWKRCRPYAKSVKQMNRLFIQSKLRSQRTATRIKFGVRVPRTYQQAMELDRQNGNKLWATAIQTEMNQMYQYETFKSKGLDASVPRGYQQIRVHLIFDVKQDGRRKARLVAGGHMTAPSEDTYYSSVVSLRGMRLVVFLAELNELELCTGDIGNAYLEAYTKEKVCFRAGKEFAFKGHDGHLMIIEKALYGLRESSSRFHEVCSDALMSLGFFRSKADSDIWMKDCGTHYEYVATWVDDLLYAGKEPAKFYKGLDDMGFTLKGVGPPVYHLGGDFKRVERANGEKPVLTWGSHTYVQRMLDSYKQIFGEAPSKNVRAALDPKDHPELDTSELLDESEMRIYWQLIGELQWLVSLGRFDIMVQVVTMSRFRPAPRKGHLERLKRIYAYLKQYKKTSIKFNVEEPDYSPYEEIPCDWGSIYSPVTEDLPSNAPPPKGKEPILTSFCDANLLHDFLTGRSQTGILHMLNKTPMEWFSKSQERVETATYGSEFVAARIAVDQIIEIRCALRYLGVPVTKPSYLFGDNLSVVNSATLPSGKLNKRHNILNYHRVREAHASGIVKMIHIKGTENPADILTKFRSTTHWFPLVKPYLLWRIGDNEKEDGSKKPRANESNSDQSEKKRPRNK